MDNLTVRMRRPVATLSFVTGLAALMAVAAPAQAAYNGPMVTLNWKSSASQQPYKYVMHQDSDNYWPGGSNGGWVFEGGDSASAWSIDWTMEAADLPGVAASGASQFVNANLAVTNNSDTFQTFFALVTLNLPKEFLGGTLMNGSVSASVQDVFFDGAEIRSSEDEPLYQAFIDDSPVQSLFPAPYSLVAANGQTESDSDTFGISGGPIAGPEALESISVLLTFELSPYDTANVVGTFEIAPLVPAPGALPLLAGLGLAFSSRRRRQ